MAVTTSSLRQAASEAAAFLMDFLKTRAQRFDGTGRWVEARESDDRTGGALAGTPRRFCQPTA
jgi:molybdopterin synthase catalytic subunit